MRVLLSSSVRGGGGIGTVTLTLARGLAARGREVVVLRHPEAAALWEGEPVLAAEPLPRGPDLNPLALWRAAATVRRWRPDVLLSLTKKDLRLSAPAARALGVPVVVRHANDQPLPGGPYGRALYGALPALHVVNSHATRATILRTAPWLDPRRVALVHNGVDVDAFAGAAPAALDLPAGAVAVGFVGRVEARKGVRELAAAWPHVAAAVPDAWLVVAGSGVLDDEIRAALAAAPRVRWLGFRRDVPAVMRALDVLAVPSHWEGFGLVAAEALAAGVPVVAADASSLPEIVRHGEEGLLVPPRDARALAAALVRLAGDAALRRRMGAAGAARVRDEFSAARMVARYDALLAAVARGETPSLT